MSTFDELRERKRRRKEFIWRILVGDAPRPKPLERVLLVLSVVVGGFVCYYFRLVCASTFEVIGFAILFAYFLLRRIWWKHRMVRSAGSAQ